MTLVKWNRPATQYPVYSRLLDNFFNDDLDFFTPRFKSSMPAVNVIEEKDNFLIEVAAPGLNKNDFKINLDNGVMNIETTREEKKEEVEKNFTRREFCYDSFSRSFTLPDSVDSSKIEANYNDGVLKVSLPKKEEARVKPIREIKIS